MTAEYLPAWIVAIADLLLIVMVVLGTRLSDSELQRAPRRLVAFFIAVSFILGLLSVMGIWLNAYGLAQCHAYNPRITEQPVLNVSKVPPARFHYVDDRQDRPLR